MLTFQRIQGLRQDSWSATAKKVLNALKNDTKSEFPENLSQKSTISEKVGEPGDQGSVALWPPLRREA